MIRAVLDTNILISSIFWKGKPYKIIKKGLNQEYRIILSLPILKETKKKLRNKFDVPKSKVDLLINILMTYSEVIDVETNLKVVKDDPDDDKIIECAVDGEADYIITGDSHLTKIGEHDQIKILKPHQFLEILEKESIS